MSDGAEIYSEIKKDLLPYESWERLEQETSAAYSAFCSYRDYGGERTIKKAVEAEYPDLPSIDKKYRLWRAWSQQHKWLKRAEDYDLYIDRLKQGELRKAIEEQGKVHRMVTGKMLGVVSKKLDCMNPSELTQGAVTEWVTAAIKAERDAAGLVNTSDLKHPGKQGVLSFAPEFEGL